MSRMKHLLRKLHIGGGHCDHPQRLAETRPVVVSPTDTAAPPQPSPSAAAQSGRIGGGESGSGSGGGGDRTAGDECLDFNLLEEEFQVQLALAISASDPDSRSDPETAQIAAAKRISLGCSTATAVAAAGYELLEILSLHYWSYNVVNYNDKVVDGFYDVYTVSSSPLAQEKIPLLVDLQQISVSDDVNYEVILVNRTADFELQRLEQRAYAVSTESRVSEYGLIFSGLIQRIADIVVDRMGGPVGDADDMTRKWTARRNELRCLLNSIILPLGQLDFGLSRHRALLFKVLADRVNLPCMLVKGSYYTGTDDGAVNLIKVEDGSEYIIDLMGAPGALIPAEVHSSQLPNSFLNLKSLPNVTTMPLGVGVLPDGGIEVACVPKVGSSRPYEAPNEPIDNVRCHVEANQNEGIENELGKSLPSLQISCQASLTTSAKASSAQKKKVKNVSKYVISAAKDPEFAQKLHAVLLESGASPPPDLFSDISPQQLIDDRFVDATHARDQKTVSDGFQYHHDNLFPRLEQPFIPMSRGNSSYYGNTDDAQNCAAESIAHKHNELSATNDTTNQGYMLFVNATTEPIQTDAISEAISPTDPSRLHTRSLREEQAHKLVFPFDANPGQSHLQNTYIGNDNMFFPDPINTDLGKDSKRKMLETTSGLCFGSDGRSTVLRDADEWEIPWEGLRIGERIGIGSCGEVYRADWNGTEVAVKKFLNQDFSGEALVQFRSEVEIMLRLRHPNVVLFRGAITRSPHFSILTEYIPRGSLYRLLHRHNTHLDEKRRMKMALDVAKGMNYLHTGHPTIVHRDLKSPNLLVDKNWVVKVCDFGLSRMKHHTFLSSKSTAGTPEWMAPEVLRNEPANEKCDVYSFGVILWEIVTSRIPWKGLNPMQVVGAVGFQNRRLEIPDEVDPEVAQIIHDCWLREPNLRPSFSQLMIRIQHLQRFFVEGTTISGD